MKHSGFYNYVGRYSGEADTALGNSLISYFINLASMLNGDYQLIIDGDDVVIFPHQHVSINDVVGNYKRYGFEVECHLCHYLEQIDTCSSKVISVNGV